MLTGSKSVGTNMGAIDPVLARNHANNMKIKSASIEANNQPLGLASSALQLQFNFDNNRHLNDDDYDGEQQVDRSKLNKQATVDGSTMASSSGSKLNAKAKKLLTLSPTISIGGGAGGASSSSRTSSPNPGGGCLKPSVSTSCLLTASAAAQAETGSGSSNEDSNNASSICLPTRASLTHEWKKLKTPNKCRECNLLVYFNGRECSFCGFVAHKKCVTILVIKCSGQTIGSGGGGLNNRNKSSKQFLYGSNNKSSSNLSTPSSSYSSSKGGKSNSNGVKPIFGQPIGNDNYQVIDFIRRFIYEIDTRGLASKGIYRVSSIKSKVDRLCNYYDQNLSSLVDLSSFHPTIIANALKMYLRQLPEPLLTHKLYNDFIELAKKYPNNNNNTNNNQQQQNKKQEEGDNNISYNKRPLHRRPIVLTTTTISINNNPAYDPMLIVEMREIIDSLPPINKELVAIIMRHLRRVADMSYENQMSAMNLSIIFGPTLLNADNKSLAIVDNIHQARCIELMITWAEQIFPRFANYESKAVIGLELSEEFFNNLRKQQDSPTFVLDQPQTSSSQEGKKNDTNERFFNFDKLPQEQNTTKTRQDLKESRRQFFTQPPTSSSSNMTSPTIVQKSNNNNSNNNYKQQQYPPPLPLPDKPITASELRPVYNSPVSKSIPSTTTNKPQQQMTDNSRRRSSNSDFNPPGTVPVIKVQPCFCNKLSKGPELCENNHKRS